MTKNGLFLTSFVAAIPGAFLAYQMVMVFINYAGGSTMWPKVLAGLLLLIAVLLAVMPVGIILFAGPKTEKSAKSVVNKADKAEADEVAAEAEESEMSARSGATDDNLEVFEGEADEFASTGKVASGEDLASGDDFDLGEGSDFEMDAAADDLFEFDEDQPKKGKKK